MYDALSFIFGLIFGSFINVLVWRIPKGLAITGRSACPKCKKQIAWFDNLPLLSFFLLRARCRNCRKPISWQYPLVELVTGIGFLLTGFNFYWLAIFCILLTIFIIDLKYQIIPDELVFSGLILNTLYSTQYTSLLAGFSAALFLLVIHLVTHGRGMGLGDVKLAILGGAIVGIGNLLYWLFLAFLTGAVAGVILILVKKLKLKSKIAFGPFLILALLLVLIR